MVLLLQPLVHPRSHLCSNWHLTMADQWLYTYATQETALRTRPLYCKNPCTNTQAVRGLSRKQPQMAPQGTPELRRRATHGTSQLTQSCINNMSACSASSTRDPAVFRFLQGIASGSADSRNLTLHSFSLHGESCSWFFFFKAVKPSKSHSMCPDNLII